MLELATRVIELTGSKSELVFRPLPSDDPMRRRPDITVARTELGWAPTVGLSDGLPLTIEHFQRVLAGQGAL